MITERNGKGSILRDFVLFTRFVRSYLSGIYATFSERNLNFYTFNTELIEELIKMPMPGMIHVLKILQKQALSSKLPRYSRGLLHFFLRSLFGLGCDVGRKRKYFHFLQFRWFTMLADIDTAEFHVLTKANVVVQGDYIVDPFLKETCS